MVQIYVGSLDALLLAEPDVLPVELSVPLKGLNAPETMSMNETSNSIREPCLFHDRY
jgi:hypothetical protein